MMPLSLSSDNDNSFSEFLRHQESFVRNLKSCKITEKYIKYPAIKTIFYQNYLFLILITYSQKGEFES